MLVRILVTLVVVLLAVRPLSATPAAGAGGYEVWISDQTNDKVLIYEGETWKLKQEIDLKAETRDRGTTKPHMIIFSQDQRYAYIANVGAPPQTNNVVVVDTQTYKVVATIATAGSAHAATPSHDGSRIWVTNTTEHHITEILFDPKDNTWKVSRKVPSYGMRPICSWFTADNSAVYVTNGGSADIIGTLAIIEVKTGKLIKQVEDFGREACGTLLAKDGKHMYISTGFHEANKPEQNDTVFVFDTSGHTQMAKVQLQGKDGHGLYESPDGKEVWVVGRASASVEIFVAPTLKPIAKIEPVGSRPDLAAFSPDGKFFFVSQRGKAVTGVVHAVSGETPGFTVIEASTRKVVGEIKVTGDVHGLAVRKLAN